MHTAMHVPPIGRQALHGHWPTCPATTPTNTHERLPQRQDDTADESTAPDGCTDSTHTTADGCTDSTTETDKNQ